MPGQDTIVTSKQLKFNFKVKATTSGGSYTVGDTRTIPTIKEQLKSNLQFKATTIGGRYTVGDRRTIPPIKIADNDIEKWQAGFDLIDIAPKDGKLSLEEVCTCRDKQVHDAKIIFWTNPKYWFNVEKQINFRSKIKAEERKTEEYRNINTNPKVPK